MFNQALEFDRTHVWHPYSQMSPSNPFMLVIESAEGSKIKTEDGQELIEAMSSWWCAIHGYNNKELNQALLEQVDVLQHVIIGGLTHKPAIDLTSKLLQLTHDKLQCVLYTDSGSASIDCSLQMALSYFRKGNSKTSKTKFLTIRHGYHGGSFAAMSICDPINSMHSMYSGYLPKNLFADAPPTIQMLPSSLKNIEQHYNLDERVRNNCQFHESDISDFKRMLEKHHREIAAVVLEPVLQGAGGLRLYHPKFLVHVRLLCNKYNVLLIVDELATGFGRTGKMWAYEHCNEYHSDIDMYPDIMCFGKGLTGGYVAMSGVIATRKVAERIDENKSFLFGSTFMANPLSCAVSIKSLEILQRGDWKHQVAKIERQLFKELYCRIVQDVEMMNTVIDDVRVAGAMGVVQTKHTVDVKWFQDEFTARSVHVRPFKKFVYIMPPYIITQAELRQVTDAIYDVLKLWKQKLMNKNLKL